MSGELLVVTALRSEFAALHDQVPGAALSRCGMGPARVASWLPELTGSQPACRRRRRCRRRARPVAAPRRHRRRERGARRATAAPSCARPHRWWPSCAGMGLRVRSGPVLTRDHVVGGRDDRERLAATGALAVDMESAAIVRAARSMPGRPPVAVVRVVVDTATTPLARPATLTSGAKALRGAAPHRRRRSAAGPISPGRAACVLAAPALVLRRRRTRDRHRRGRAAALPAPGLRPAPDRAQRPRRARSRAAGRGVRRRARRGARRHHPGVLRARRGPRGPGRGRRGAGSTSSTPPARWSRRCTPRPGASPAAATPSCSSGTTVTTRPRARSARCRAGSRWCRIRAEAERVDVADPERVSFLMQTTLAVDDAAATVDVLRRRFPLIDVLGDRRHLLRHDEPAAGGARHRRRVRRRHRAGLHQLLQLPAPGRGRRAQRGPSPSRRRRDRPCGRSGWRRLVPSDSPPGRPRRRTSSTR